MSTVTLKGNTVNLEGKMPSVGDTAPDFKIVKQDLSEITLGSFSGKVKILVAVPSLDTATCAMETRKFNEKAASLSGATTLIISGDLPFAMKRFCATEGINTESLVTGSQFRDFSFSKAYGTHIADGGLKGLSARAIFVVDKNDKIAYVELVPEITSEPQYDKVMDAAKALL